MGRNTPRSLPSSPTSPHPPSQPSSLHQQPDSFLTPSQRDPSFHPDNGKCWPGLCNWFNVIPEFSLEILISEVRRFMPRGDLVNIFFIAKYAWILVNCHGKNRSTILSSHQLSIYCRAAYPVCVLFIFLILLSLAAYHFSHVNALKTFTITW